MGALLIGQALLICYYIFLQLNRGGMMMIKTPQSPFQSWNQRVLEVLEQTYVYDAALMEKWSKDGELQNLNYLQRLEVYRGNLT
jgi:hypothetical protein